MRSVPSLLVAALLAAGLGGCSRSTDPPEAGDSTFVRTMVELRRIEADVTVPELARDSLRGAVLRRHGLTAEQFEAAARDLATDPERAATVWAEVHRRLAAGDTIEPPQ